MELQAWETCEIGVRGQHNARWFYAAVIGPEGRSIVAVSPVFDGGTSDNQKAIFACDALIRSLTSDGWEALGRNGEWWQLQFRRRVTPGQTNRTMHLPQTVPETETTEHTTPWPAILAVLGTALAASVVHAAAPDSRVLNGLVLVGVVIAIGFASWYDRDGLP